MVAAVLILLGTTLGVVHNRLAAAGRNDPITGGVRTITAPFVGSASAVGDWFSRQTGSIFHGRSMAEENRRLIEENARLRDENALLKEADATARRLSTQLGFAQKLPPKTSAAHVIASRPSQGYETVVIDRGARDGIGLRSVVVAPGGLVGRVYDVSLTTAAVLLITDTESAVGAIVQRPESRAMGVCKGDRTSLLSLVYLDPESDVKVGDSVITSGLGGAQGVFPKGLVIGSVQAVGKDAGATRLVKVHPSVDFTRLEEVYVLR